MMKRIFVSFFALLFSLMVFAQGEHFTFKGIPIDGTLSSFMEQLQKQGFAWKAKDDNGAVFTGKFAGVNDCCIVVHCSEGVVTAVSVMFPVAETWSELYGRFSSLKEMLTKKYGYPAVSKEVFQSYTPSNDEMKLFAVEQDNTDFLYVFEPKNGSIELSLSHRKVEYYEEKAFVLLKYFDKINYSKKESSAYDDL